MRGLTLALLAVVGLGGFLVLLLGAGLLFWVSTPGGEFIPSTDETRFGADILDADRQTVETLTGIDLPSTAAYHAYHFESALDQRMMALVTMAPEEAKAVLGQPLLANATWEAASGLPGPASDLSAWPETWGEPTITGRSTFIDAAPGRQLAVKVSDSDTDITTLQISWTTY